MDLRDELLRAAVDITRAASGLAAQRFLEGVPVSKKADGTEVTPADTEVEELIRSMIAARFPDDGVTGEELADTPGTTGRRWVIDPIDGTSAFALRIPMFNVLLAVEDDEGSAVSVISYPMSQDLIYAGRGRGCWHQVNDGPPQRITVSSARHPGRDGQPGHLVRGTAHDAAPGGPPPAGYEGHVGRGLRPDRCPDHRGHADEL